MMERTNGFYWVEYYGEWLVAKWYQEGEYWVLPGVIMSYWDSDFKTIIETPINYPQGGRENNDTRRKSK